MIHRYEKAVISMATVYVATNKLAEALTVLKKGIDDNKGSQVLVPLYNKVVEMYNEGGGGEAA